MAEKYLKRSQGKQEASRTVSPFELANIRFFLAFRVLFNARFYYPVFTILFLDFGLTLDQFALLNTVWAFTIVLAVVPTGALADIIGRKRLLVASTLLMVAEMSCLAFVPLGNRSLVFSAFLANRILSGLSEAMADGADEALAYDTLEERGITSDWPRVLDVQLRLQNFSYIFAMTLGAAIYDPGMINRFLSWLGLSISVTQQMSMRYPIYLTLLLSLLGVAVTLKMRDPEHGTDQKYLHSQAASLKDTLRLTLQAGNWIFKTPLALAIILFAMTFDHVLRMTVTLTSQYYRIIDLPEASFGFIGSSIAALGLLVPRLAHIMIKKFSPGKNVVILGLLMITTLFLLALFVPYLGLIPMMVVFIGLMLTSFLTSHYLNEITESHQRATVLSFKGLAFNAAYGVIGIVYAVLVQQLRHRQMVGHPDWSQQLIADEVFRKSQFYFPWYLTAILIFVSLLCLPRLYRRH